MTRHEKLIAKLLNPHTALTWQELTALLSSLGYQRMEGNGSRIKFDNGAPEAAISLHKPHPGNEIKAYVRRQVINHLQAGGLL